MVLLHSMLLLQECSYVGKGFFLSFFCQHIKEPLQDFPRIGMKRGVFAALVVGHDANLDVQGERAHGAGVAVARSGEVADGAHGEFLPRWCQVRAHRGLVR